MAVIPIFDSVEVEILVNGQPVTEYPDPDTLDIDDDGGGPAGRVVTRYIEAKTGTEFSIRFKISPTFRLLLGNVDLVVCVYVDNKYMVGNVINRTNLNYDAVQILSGHRYTKSGQWFERSFSFSQLNIVEGLAERIDEAKMSQLANTGKISARLCRVVARDDKHISQDIKADVSLDKKSDISEKAIKGRALTHGAGLGAQRSIPQSRVTVVDYIDSKDKPYAQYDFKYRSLASLKSLLVIPRSPSPVPLEDRPTYQLSEAELRELVDRQRQQLQASKAVKREVKRERGDSESSGRPAKSARTSGGPVETIDLTDD